MMEAAGSYIEIKVKAAPEMQEIFIAELAENGFDHFVEGDDHVSAFATFDHYLKVKELVDEIILKYGIEVISQKEIKNDINWNSKWEENFEPVMVDDDIYVRALFHPSMPGIKHEILIQPKMSFGTGHHETTQLMLTLMLELDFKDAACLDMGTGTGVLAILASRLGASYIAAVDYDQWCILNASENFELNDISNIQLFKNDIAFISDEHFNSTWKTYDKHVILSNITRNYNMENLPAYGNISNPGDVIILSGFYESDLEDLKEKALNSGLNYVKSKVKNSWCAAVFKRPR
jgi:ribosomal protein L11 methyltransferase